MKQKSKSKKEGIKREKNSTLWLAISLLIGLISLLFILYAEKEKVDALLRTLDSFMGL